MECMSFNQLFMIPQQLLVTTTTTTTDHQQHHHHHHHHDTSTSKSVTAAAAAATTACSQSDVQWEPAINFLLAFGILVMILVSVLSAYMEAMNYLKSQQTPSATHSSTANGKSTRNTNNNNYHQYNLIGTSNAKDHDRANLCSAATVQSLSETCNSKDRAVGGGGGGGGGGSNNNHSSPSDGVIANGVNVTATISTSSSHHHNNSNNPIRYNSLSSHGKTHSSNSQISTNKNAKVNSGSNSNSQKNNKRKNSNATVNNATTVAAIGSTTTAPSSAGEKPTPASCKPIGSTISDRKSSNIYAPMFQNLTNVIASPPPPLPAFDSEEFDSSSQSGRGDDFKKLRSKKTAKKSKKTKKESQASESNSIAETDSSVQLEQLTVMLNHQPTTNSTKTAVCSSSSASSASTSSAASLVSSTKSSALLSSTSSTASSSASSTAPSSTSSSPPLSASSYGEYSLLGPGVTFELPCLRVRSAQI